MAKEDNSQNKKIRLGYIFLVGFLFSSQVALTTYINSSFLANFLSDKNVGLLYTLGSLVSIAALALTPKILNKVGGYKFLIWLVASNGASLLLLSMLKTPWTVVPVLIFYLSINSIIIFTLDEFLEIFSRRGTLGGLRGFYLSATSLAWVLAQPVLGKVLNHFSFSVVYFICFEIMVVLLLIAFFYLKNLPDPKYDRAQIWPSIKKFFKQKNLARAYKMNFILQFFYAFMVIYTPLYLSAHLNFNWEEIGTMFTIMLIPFVFAPFPLGKYSDKIGEKKMLMAGFALAALATFFLFFIKWHAVWIWALALLLTRIGASAVEIMSDIYFFRHIDKENDEFVSIYRNTLPTAYVLAPLVAFIIFSFTPTFNFIYIFLGTLLLFGVYLASQISERDS